MSAKGDPSSPCRWKGNVDVVYNYNTTLDLTQYLFDFAISATVLLLFILKTTIFYITDTTT